jgi:hypothetical protein
MPFTVIAAAPLAALFIFHYNHTSHTFSYDLRLVSTGIVYEPLVQAVSEVAAYQQPYYLLTRLVSR